MAFNQPDISEGQAILCDPSNPIVYRYTNGQRRAYPDPNIASSWDPNWYKVALVDCTKIPLGDVMEFNQPDAVELSSLKSK
jgi:hypothetical protein